MLAAMPGVGRVTAARLFRRFDSHPTLLTYGREQVLVRLKGLPSAEALVQRLYDADVMGGLSEEAAREHAMLLRSRVAVVHPRHPHWPARLEMLPPSERPFLLYVYGRADLLGAPGVAFIGADQIPEAPFEAAQQILRAVARSPAAVLTGLQHGFDVAASRLAVGAGRGPLMVAGCGLARIERAMRPAASAAVAAGGALVSCFPMMHGPYPHDDRERLHVQMALAEASVFAAPPPGAHAASALEWGAERGFSCALLPADLPSAAASAERVIADLAARGLAEAPA